MIGSVLLALVPAAGVSHSTMSEPSPAALNLLSYITQPGDRVVTVPNGTYAGGSVTAPHPATSGQYGGWLILQAATKHGVTVTGDLQLAAGTSRVLFVGFRFVNTRLFVGGEHIAFWYTDHVYPDASWYAAGRPLPRQVFLRNPGRAISLLGSDLHNGVASPINISGVHNVDISGVQVYDVNEPAGSDPADQSHLNVISLLGGATSDLVVSHSYFRGGRLNHQTDNGDVTGLTYEDVWYTGAFGTAFQFNATNAHRIVDGVRRDVRSWGHVGKAPQDRNDRVDGVTVPDGSRPDRVDVVDERVVNSPPPAGTANPATRWRQQHPYGGWADYFGWVTTPGSPRSLSAAVATPTSGVGSGQVRLTWQAPVSPGSSALIDYIVQRSPNGTSGWVSLSDGPGTATNHTVTGLANGFRYYFRVFAKNSSGTGAGSNVANAVPRTTPSAARSLVWTRGGSGQIRLWWQAPASTGGSPVTDYVIQRSPNGTSGWVTIPDGVRTTTNFTVGGLTNGVRYHMRVVPINAAGYGAASNVVNTVPLTVPSATRALWAIPAGSGRVWLSWTPPTSNGGSAITDYVIQRSPNGRTGWVSFSDGVGTTTNYTAAGLANGFRYYFRVVAKNSMGYGPAGNVPDAVPRTVPSAVRSLFWTPGAAGEVRLWWTAPASNGGSPVTDYVVQRSPDGTSGWISLPDGVGTTTNYTVRGLSNATRHYFRVVAKNAAGFGPASNIVGSPAATLAIVPTSTVDEPVPDSTLPTTSTGAQSTTTTSPSGTLPADPDDIDVITQLPDTEEQRSITFPVVGAATVTDDWMECRADCTTFHNGSDVLAAKLQPIVAPVDGVVLRLVDDPSAGVGVVIRDLEGYEYHLYHLNNDSPGTDDGQAGDEWRYGPGIAPGAAVVSGQLIGYVGDSGEAENGDARVHVEIRRPDGTSINPYRSLLAARHDGLQCAFETDVGADWIEVAGIDVSPTGFRPSDPSTCLPDPSELITSTTVSTPPSTVADVATTTTEAVTPTVTTSTVTSVPPTSTTPATSTSSTTSTALPSTSSPPPSTDPPPEPPTSTPTTSTIDTTFG
jgi:hypothetical protein